MSCEGFPSGFNALFSFNFALSLPLSAGLGVFSVLLSDCRKGVYRVFSVAYFTTLILPPVSRGGALLLTQTYLVVAPVFRSFLLMRWTPIQRRFQPGSLPPAGYG